MVTIVNPFTFRILAFTVFLLISTSTVAWAQEEAETDSTAWKKSLVALLAGSQASYDNWAEGGINSLAFTASLNGDAERTTTRWIQKHEMRLALGSLKQDTLDFRKADDLIKFLFTFQYQKPDKISKWNPTAAIDFRTQFANGFDYSGAEPVKISAFFSPATITETVGFTYTPQEWFTWLIGFAGKQTIVGIEDLRESFGNDPDQTMRFEAGFNSQATIDKNIFENVHLKSGLGIFAAFDQIDNPDVRWENLITMTVNSWLTVGFEFVTFYDLDISNRAQFKQVLSTGISIGLL